MLKCAITGKWSFRSKTQEDTHKFYSFKGRVEILKRSAIGLIQKNSIY